MLYKWYLISQYLVLLHIFPPQLLLFSNITQKQLLDLLQKMLELFN